MELYAVVIAWAVAFGTTAICGFWIIPMLRTLRAGQTILEIGPKWHKNKQGTPTMGGLLFVIGISLGVVAGYALLRFSPVKDLFYMSSPFVQKLWIGMLMALAFGFVGFIDDYIKVTKKQNEGLTGKQKLIFQGFIATGYVVSLYLTGGLTTTTWVPFFGSVRLGIWFYPLAVLGIMFFINATNFTDGIDGLLSSVTAVVGMGFLVVFTIFPGRNVVEMQLLSAALIGGCMGFLIWNYYPAKVFMGDTGSFFLGGIVVALAFSVNIPLILLLMGFVYIVEAITVIVQTIYFKYTRRRTGEGKRLFKMTPIHHSFEISGWSETKIVVVFSLVQVICCLLGIRAVWGLS